MHATPSGATLFDTNLSKNTMTMVAATIEEYGRNDASMKNMELFAVEHLYGL